MPDREIEDLQHADLKALVEFAYDREAPPDEDQRCSEVLEAAGRVHCFVDQLERGQRSLLEIGVIADDALRLASYGMATSSERVDPDLAFDNVTPAAERVGGWFREFVRARNPVETSRYM